jgi:hypothetical protein
MFGLLVVGDFRNSETWIRARCLVCPLLDLTVSWSKSPKYRPLAKTIERHSVALLHNIIRGCEGPGDKYYVSRAKGSIDRLERMLQKALRCGALLKSESTLLRSNLNSVKHSLRVSE